MRYLPGEGRLDLLWGSFIYLLMVGWLAAGITLWLLWTFRLLHGLGRFRARFPWLVLPACFLGSLVLGPVVAWCASLALQAQREARLAEIIEAHAGQSPIDLEEFGEYGFDDVAYLVRERERPADSTTTVLDFKGIQWSDEKLHVVARGKAKRIVFPRADLAMAYPMQDGWWYVWLNN